jgi:hypothetical protein
MLLRMAASAAACLVLAGALHAQVPGRNVKSSNNVRKFDKESDEMAYRVRKELPGPDLIFRRDSEEQFKDRLRQEAMAKSMGDTVTFPVEDLLTKEKTVPPRQFPRAVRSVEPSYVCHRRIIFEQTNFDRLGYDFGIFQPPICLGVFYFDLLTFPYQMCKRPFEQFDCSAGKVMPGDPSPMLLYPPEPSISGLLGEFAVGTGLFLAFP